MRVNIDQMGSEYLREMQTIQLGVEAPLGFQDMAFNNGSYLALTAPRGSDVFWGFNTYTPIGNVYVIDIGKIDQYGRIDSSAIATIDASKFSNDRGQFPNYVTAGKNDGEFVVSASNSRNAGFVGITVGLDDHGNLDGSAVVRSATLTPKESNPAWLNAKFQQNIQRAQGNVVVEYGGKQYALIGDYNFDFNDVHSLDYENWGVGKQIGGKIGIVEDPFGSAKYLGATTPIVGEAVDQITLGADGKLYADVWMYNDVLDDGSMHHSLFVGDAAALVQAAVNSRNQKTSTPIDRISGEPGAAGQRTEAVPARYDSFGNAQTFFWNYGVGAYSVPGRFAALRETPLNAPAIVASGGEYNVYKDMLGISDKQIAQAKEDGTIPHSNTSRNQCSTTVGISLPWASWKSRPSGFTGSRKTKSPQLHTSPLRRSMAWNRSPTLRSAGGLPVSWLLALVAECGEPSPERRPMPLW